MALIRGWTETLRTNLEDPTVSGNVELVTDATGKRELQKFLKSKQLPDPVSPAFIRALQDVLSGLQKVTLTSQRPSECIVRRRATLHGCRPT